MRNPTVTLCLAALLASAVTAPAMAARGDKAEAIFDQRDSNRDGVLSRAEFVNQARDPQRADQFFGRLDQNGDGRLTRSEFDEGMRELKQMRANHERGGGGGGYGNSGGGYWE